MQSPLQFFFSGCCAFFTTCEKKLGVETGNKARWLQHTIFIILTTLSAMTFLHNEVRCIWCETGRNCCGEKREGQSAKDYLLILILILILNYNIVAKYFCRGGCFTTARHSEYKCCHCKQGNPVLCITFN